MLSQTNYNSRLLVRYGIRYDINDISTDSSSSIILDKLNPSIGLTYKVNSNDNIFFSFGTSFETPTLNELSNNPYGEGLNKNLKSSSSLNYEIGLRKAVSNLTLEAIAYFISSENEILPYELEQFPGKNFYQNVGSTSRYGLELNSQLSFEGGRINLSYTLSKNKFEDFIIDNNNLADNLIPGIPSQMLDLDLIFKLSRGRSLIISNRLIGERYADNANETLINSCNMTYYFWIVWIWNVFSSWIHHC